MPETTTVAVQLEAEDIEWLRSRFGKDTDRLLTQVVLNFLAAYKDSIDAENWTFDDVMAELWPTQ